MKISKEDMKILQELVDDIIDDEKVSDKELFQYIFDAIELVFPNRFSEPEKSSIILETL